MQPPDAGPRVAPAAAAREGAAGAPLAEAIPQLIEMLDPAEETTSGMLEAEEALRLLHERFDHAEDPELRAELAAQALDHVERQLRLIGERRRQLDSIEAKLWARQNRLEGFLIHARGSDWWHARRNGANGRRSDG